MIYVLLHKNVEVLTFKFSTERKPFYNIISIINEKHLPLGTNITNKNTLVSSLSIWWESRLIPRTRKINEESPDILEKYYKNSYGLNLSDHYWIKPIDSNVDWNSINFYTNNFDEDIGKYIITYGRSTVRGITNALSPDLYSNGEQDKRWIIDKDERCLLKYALPPHFQEPLNECLTSELCRRLNFSHVKYVMVVKKEKEDRLYSSCSCFTDENTEYVPAAFVQFATKINKTESAYNHLIRCCEYLGMKDIKNIENKLMEMILIDYIMANIDRHWGNFGFLRDVNSLEWLGVAPLFDTGNALFYQTINRDIINSKSLQENVISRTFASTQKIQLKKFANKICEMNINFDALNGIENYYSDLCSKSSHCYKERVDLLSNILLQRIKDAKRIIFTYNDTTKEFLRLIKQSSKPSLVEKLRECLITFSNMGEKEKRITENYINSIDAKNPTELFTEIEKDMSKI